MQRKTACGPRGNFLRQINLFISPTAQLSLPPPGPAAAAGLGQGKPSRALGRASGASPVAPRASAGRAGWSSPAAPAGTARHPRTPAAAEGAAAAPGAAGTGKVPVSRRGRRRHRAARGQPAPPASRPAAAVGRGGAAGPAASPLAAARGGRAAIGVRRSQCRPAPPRRGFITGIPMAEAGNLPRREGAEPARGTARAARQRTRCRRWAEGRPPGRAASGGRRAPPSRRCPAAPEGRWCRGPGAARGLARSCWRCCWCIFLRVAATEPLGPG